ncbi:type II CRISPR RNA-guided endonuclease Cas9 [Candidatus Saccharibacteria bacterium]|nr:MAG: type II CRISPR RNA-guided endonuclease Cas9 [Candidatus Saccharibacteria bacterium]
MKSMKYSLGLDIGTASIGWAVIDLEKQRIHDLGVRIFEKPENPKDGDSLAKPRRDARSARRRLHRRRHRLNNLKQFFVQQKILSDPQIKDVLDPRSKFNSVDVYKLRSEALTRELTPEELFKVLYHIGKRRGYKSNRKADEESDPEGGRVIKALSINQQLLADNKYQTVGQALAQDKAYQTHKRNKRDSYTNSFARADFLHELEEIVKAQKQYALHDVSQQSIRELIYGVNDNGELTEINAIMYQRPFMTEELIKKMVGECTFETGEKRAPKASHSFEVFRFAVDLSNLVFIPKSATKHHARKQGLRVQLNEQQIQDVINEAKKVRKITYKKVRNVAGLDEEYTPEYVRGKVSSEDPYGENNAFGSLEAYHDIRAALKDLPDDWQKVDNEDTLNQIAYILTVQRADDAIKKSLEPLPISDAAKKALLKIKPKNFRTFGHLSIKALQKITPHILAGKTYDKACEAAGYDFRKKAADLSQITNPVVKRAISQTNKVVRAIIRKYGKPYYIRVETARDLAKSYKDRQTIEAENKENQANNELVVERLKELGCITPTGLQVIKLKLYDEQNGKCLYSGKPIDLTTMLADDNAYQIDHIVPFSRSNNDGLTNKALVLTAENQNKADRTPYEYFGYDEQRWRAYCAQVEATYKTRDIKAAQGKDKAIAYKQNGYAMRKKQNLLIQEYKNDSWNVRALNDTRYITRFVQNYLRQTVDFADGDEKQRVFAPNGTLTSYLRKRWGLSKNREEDVLHHAKDAAVVAAIDQPVILRANLYAKKGEITNYLLAVKTMEEKTDKLTGEITDESGFNQAQRRKNALEVLSEDHFPKPWTDFDKEVRKRTLPKDTATVQNELIGLKNYDDAFRLQVQPIFVSRMPRRKATGKAHKETIRSPKAKDDDQRTVRMPLNKVKSKDVENSTLKESDKWLYNTLKDRLRQHGDNPEKAFAEPVYKNSKKQDKNGRPLSPVSTIKVYSTQPSGFYINDNKAFVNNGSMTRLDVYKKASKKGKTEHFFVPVYAHQVGKNRPTPTEILPKPKGFSHVDETFTKVCSLYPNDYIRCIFGDGRVEEGYYRGYNVANGQMDLLFHADANSDNIMRKNKRSAISIERFDISILGDNAPRS